MQNFLHTLLTKWCTHFKTDGWICLCHKYYKLV